MFIEGHSSVKATLWSEDCLSSASKLALYIARKRPLASGKAR